jgi:CRISPR system Cascade subunit CasE
MYLSKLTLNTANIQARKDLGNPHEMHRTIMRAFPEALAQDERVLFRVENILDGQTPIVLVQSVGQANWDSIDSAFEGYFLQHPQSKTLADLCIQNGDVLRFRMRVSISKRVKYKDTGKSKRISLFSESDRTAWLKRKAKAGGFSLDDGRLIIRDAPYRNFAIKKPEQTHHATLNMVDVDGLLRVEVYELFIETLKNGIGPAKGMGCGLLSLAK